MGVSELIRILLIKKGNISEAELARRMGMSPQNLHNKFKRDYFTESDIVRVGKALDCEVKISFTINDTGEIVEVIE